MKERQVSPGLQLAVDYAPLLIFLAVTFIAPSSLVLRLVAAATAFLADEQRIISLVMARVICATAAFIIATVIAMIVSRAKLGRISPMLWISGVLIVFFGGLTIWFQDERFIQMKPTFVYTIFAGVLGFGLLTGRPLLAQLFGSAYPGLTEAGWRRLTVNWTLFFVALAVANEAARAVLSYKAWVLFKFPGCAMVTLAFAAANIPMLLRHGLTLDEGEAAVRELPPE